MYKLSVYLAGAISDVSKEEATQWRDDFKAQYGDCLEIFNPLARDEEYKGLTGKNLYKAIADGERMDILNSDATFAYIGTSSMGTAMGIMYAYLSGRTVIIIKDRPDRKLSKMVLHHNHKVCDSFEEAVEFLKSRHDRNSIKTIKRRDGTTVPWNFERIHNAIQKAVNATSEIYPRTKSFEPPRVGKLASTVKMQLEDELLRGNLSYEELNIEQVQDMVEKVLMDNAHRDEVHTFAKEYIVYRRKQIEKRAGHLSDDESRKFIADSLHDFKNPAANLGRYLDWLEKAIKENKEVEVHENLNDIKETQVEMMKLIKQRKVAAEDRFQTISQDLHSFVQKEFDLNRNRNCKFHNNVEQGLIVEVTSYRLQTILKNLIENSLKHGFGHDGGDIYIEAKPLNENRILVEYWNSGNEITQEQADKMFYEKKQPSSDGESFQHGMPQVLRYVEDLGGTIECSLEQQEEAKGDSKQISTGKPMFRFTLPAGKKVQKRTILVADDNPNDRKMMRKILNKAGMEVLEAKSPKEALEKVKNTKIHGAVIDMDFKEELNGVWLLNKLDNLCPGLEMIVVSGADSLYPENWRENALKFGAAEIYDKSRYREEQIIQHFET